MSNIDTPPTPVNTVEEDEAKRKRKLEEDEAAKRRKEPTHEPIRKEPDHRK